MSVKSRVELSRLWVRMVRREAGAVRVRGVSLCSSEVGKTHAAALIAPTISSASAVEAVTQ